MAVQWSTTVRNALLDQWETTIGTSAVLRMYTGSAPSNCAASATGSKIAEFSLASDWASSASSGTKALSSTPLASTGLTPGGTLGYYRIYDSAGTTCHEQGTITVTGGGGDMTVDNTSLSTGQTINVTGFTKTAPGA
jgi:hypothetical protein